MKTLAVIAALAAGLVGGYAAQAYSLPRVGLHALDFGQYLVLFGIYVVAHTVIAVCKEVIRA
jgi:hypothetical protein